MTANASRRQTCKALDEELSVLLADFAAKHGLALTPSRGGSYSTSPMESYMFKVEFVGIVEGMQPGGVSMKMAHAIASGLAFADPLAYPEGAREVLEAAALAGRLFKFGDTAFGPIVGWNTRAPKAPLQFTCVSKDGEPCAPRGYKTRDFRASAIGMPANFSPVLDVQVDDRCYVDYEGSDEEGDEQGYYAATITGLGKKSATVKYDNGVEGPVAYDRLIVRPRFI